MEVFAYQDALGMTLPRTTYDMLDQLTPIDGSDLRPGDLIFPSDHHVFMYTGGGNVIEAAHTGTQISEHEYRGNGTMFRRVLDNPPKDTGKVGTSISSADDDVEDDSSNNPLENAFNQLSDITSSYIGTIMTGETWDESKMKKKKSSSSGGTVSGDMSSISGYSTGTDQISDAVLALRPTVEKYANQYGIGDKVDLLLAQIMQEAGGEPNALANDPMQSAEGHGMAAGSLHDQDLSIQWGCEEFANRLNDAGGNIPLTLQSYNFGQGFINYVNSHGGQMTQDLVNSFSDEQAAKMGWSGYGDKQYVQHVLRYYGGGSGEDNFIMPMDIAGMRDSMNYDSFGGAGDETTSSINTDDFIYNNYKDINDKSHDILTATEMSRNNNANIDEIIELLKAIKQNTFNTVEAVKEASNKISTVNSTIQNNTVNQTNVNNNNQNDQNKQNNSLQNQLTTESSDKVNNAYFKAMQIAKGRRR